MVRLTPIGLLVISRQFLISFASFSGEPGVSAVMKPSAPALATAATSLALPTRVMPPMVIGTSTPNISVKRVLIMACPFDGDWPKPAQRTRRTQACRNVNPSPSPQERIAHHDRVVALRAGGEQRHRCADQFLDATDILDRLRRKVGPAARAARRIIPAFHGLVDGFEPRLAVGVGGQVVK